MWWGFKDPRLSSLSGTQGFPAHRDGRYPKGVEAMQSLLGYLGAIDSPAFKPADRSCGAVNLGNVNVT